MISENVSIQINTSLFKIQLEEEKIVASLKPDIPKLAIIGIPGPGGTSKFAVAPDGADLTSANTLTTYSNEGASTLAVFNLDDPSVKTEFAFIVQNANGIKIQAKAGSTIRIGDGTSSDGGYLQSENIGSVIRILAINLTEWFAISSLGSWDSE